MRTAVLLIAVIAALMTGALTLPRAVAAQVHEGWFGTWKLNTEKSTYDPGPPPYKRATFTIEPAGDRVHVTYDMVLPRGGVTHLEWTGTFDGREYPVQGVEEFITYAYNRIDDRTYEIVTRLDGRVAATSRAVLSEAGNTITTTTVGQGFQGRKVTTRTVYEKVKS